MRIGHAALLQIVSSRRSQDLRGGARAPSGIPPSRVGVFRSTGRGAAASVSYPAAMPSDRLASRPLTQPHPSRLNPDNPRYDEIVAAHTAALRLGDAGYLDPATG